MKRTKGTIEKAITALLNPHGFSKKGSVWTLRCDEALLGVWLQTSRYAKAGYVNFMAWYPALAPGEHGSFAKGDFHLSFRGDVAKRDEILAELRFDEVDIDMNAYVERLDSLFFAESLSRLLVVKRLNEAIAFCRRSDPSMSYSLELVAAAGMPIS